MVTAAMRRYKRRTPERASLIGGRDGPIDPPALFGRRAPLRLEIGCGHGEFIAQMAAAHPDEDFLGVEIDPLRINKAAHKCLGLGAANVRLFDGDAHRLVHDRLPPGLLSRIYILFPDPWPKLAQRRRRLVNRCVLLDLARAAAPGCRLLFASDTHDYAFQVLANATTLPGLWRTAWPGGFRFDIPTRFPTVFERHKKAEGCSIAYVLLERTAEPAPASPPLPVGGPGLPPDAGG